MNTLKAITKDFNNNGAYYRFVRENSTKTYFGVSAASHKRVERILGGAFAKKLYTHDYPSYVTMSYEIVDRPYRDMDKDSVSIYQDLYGNLIIEASEETRKQIAEDMDSDDYEYEYPQVDEYLYSLFESGDLEWHDDLGRSGFGLTNAPGIFLRVYYPEGHEKYNGSDDDLGTDYAKSKLWAYTNYVFNHPLEILARDGRVVFTCVPNDEDED